MYYPRTIEAIRTAVEAQAPGTIAEFTELEKDEIAPLAYLLWMCEQIEQMDISSQEQSLKAARWIGWMLAHIEIHGLWDNQRSRDLIRIDKRGGHDRPHT